MHLVGFIVRRTHLSIQKFTSITLDFNVFAYIFPRFKFNSNVLNHTELLICEGYGTVNFSCTKKKNNKKMKKAKLPKAN